MSGKLLLSIKATLKRVAFFIISSLAFVTFLSGCASDARQMVKQKVALNGWQSETRKSGDFYIYRAYAKNETSDLVTIIIEGDGFAWKNRFEPSSDPTPHSPVGFDIANRISGTVAYLARPCQYINPETQGLNCAPVMWTSARYALEVVSSLNHAIDQIKQAIQAKRIKLIGYSGGGTLALLIAANRDDIEKLITIAAPIDINAWSKFHKISPLSHSLNPMNDLDKWIAIPQAHYAGSRDEIVPVTLYQKALQEADSRLISTLHVIRGYTHGCCWDQIDFNRHSP